MAVRQSLKNRLFSLWKRVPCWGRVVGTLLAWCLVFLSALGAYVARSPLLYVAVQLFHLVCCAGAFLATTLLVFRRTGERTTVPTPVKPLYSVAALFLLAESLFTFVPKSHGVGYTLASLNWMALFWHPVNEQGFRDRPWEELHTGKRIVLVVGDSFAAGAGLAFISDRFGDVMAEKLPGERFAVMNLGRSGTCIRDAYLRITDFPARPDYVVLQYFLNDIEGAASEHGKRLVFPRAYNDIPRWVRPWVLSSYLLNYLYWEFPHKDLEPYERFLVDCFADEAILATHMNDLRAHIDLARDCDIRLVMVLFPALTRIDVFRDILERIEDMARSNGVLAINVTDLVQGMDVAERTVSATDGHPSVRVHRLVGEKLAETILRMEGLAPEG